MSLSINISIVSPEGLIFSGVADMIHARAEQGEIGVLPRHTPFLSTLRPGTVKIDSGDEEEFFYVSGGIIEVQPDSVTILADTIIRAEELDEKIAQEAYDKAKQVMDSKDVSSSEVLAVSTELSRSLAQLESIKQYTEKARKRGLMK